MTDPAIANAGAGSKPKTDDTPPADEAKSGADPTTAPPTDSPSEERYSERNRRD